VVGVWSGRPVRFDLFFDPRPVRLTPDEFRATNWSALGMTYERCLRDLEECERRATSHRRQQLGRAGAVTFNEDYRREILRLRDADRSLGGVIEWPFRRGSVTRAGSVPAVAADSGELRSMSETEAELVTGMTLLLRRWELSSPVSWELPLPQGPLEDVPAGLAERLLGPELGVTVYPSYFNPPPGEEIAERVRTAQVNTARQLGSAPHHPVAGIAGRDGHDSQPGSAYRMWFFEQAARSRYGDRSGLVARLVDAFAELFDFSTDHARDLRRLYTHLFRA
jgi:hypothetical protein